MRKYMQRYCIIICYLFAKDSETLLLKLMSVV